MINRIKAPTGNYYGGPAVWKLDDRFYIGTENYDGWDDKECEISEEFYNAWVKEFNSNRPYGE